MLSVRVTPMQNYNFKVVIKIWHPTIDPSLITDTLSIQPNRTCMSGVQRSTPKGTLLDGVYRESYWYTDPYNRGECASTDYLAEDLIEETVSLLEPHISFIHKLVDEGGRVHIQVSTYGDRSYAIELSHSMLMRLSALKVSYVQDVY